MRLIAILICSALCTTAAFAHDHERPELLQWFRSLHNKAGGSCCDESEATRLDDVDWDVKDGHYRVHLQDRWIDVQDGAVIEQPNRSGPAMIWPYYINGELIGIRCFIPGAGG